MFYTKIVSALRAEESPILYYRLLNHQYHRYILHVRIAYPTMCDEVTYHYATFSVSD